MLSQHDRWSRVHEIQFPFVEWVTKGHFLSQLKPEMKLTYYVLAECWPKILYFPGQVAVSNLQY